VCPFPSIWDEGKFCLALSVGAAFHDIIAMSLDHRFTGVTNEALENELGAVLNQLVRGISVTR
jgi:hypothetical protein